MNNFLKQHQLYPCPMVGKRSSYALLIKFLEVGFFHHICDTFYQSLSNPFNFEHLQIPPRNRRATSQPKKSSLPSSQTGISRKPGTSLESPSSKLSADDHHRGPSLFISVIGATGELARKKIFPALFALYYSGFLPEVVLL